MARTLTKKQRGFVKDYIETGNGTLAVKRNYAQTTDQTARAIAYENLTKPHIVKSIADAIPDELLTEKHLALLHKTTKTTVGEETYEEIDVQAVSKGLDMGYKLKGSYAPTETTTKNLNIEVKIENVELEAIRKEYEEKLKAKLTQ